MLNKMLVGLAAAAVSLAACGGGGGTASTVSPTAKARSLSVTFRGAPITGSSSMRAARDVAPGTLVTVTYNGQVVGSGSFDAQNHATISIDPSVPAGARVTINVGNEHPSVVLANTTNGTIATVTVNGNGTVTVIATDDVDGSGVVSANDNENQENDNEDQNGNVDNGQAGQSPGPSASPSASPSPVASASPSASASPVASSSPSPTS